MKMLKFSASWCQPCKQLTETLKGMELPFPVSEIDVDQNRDAAIEYGIRGVPTLILLDEDNNQLKRLSGAMTKQQLTKELGLEQ
jgi:thioredoxin 1